MAQTTSCRSIKVGAAKSLGNYFSAALSAASVNPHLTLTVPQIADVAFDAERFQFWYVQRQSPAAVTITSSSAADPTTITTASAHFVAPGDIILIAGHDLATRNGTFTVLTTPTDTTFTIDVSSAGAGGTGGTFTLVSQYRLITSTGLPAASTITLQRAFQGGAAFTALPAGTLFDFFLILSPDEWKDCADEAIKDKFYKDRLSITLAADTTEYDLTDSTAAHYAPWFQSKGQFIRARFRDTSSAAAPLEWEVPAIYFNEDDYGVVVRFPTLPSDVASVKVIIEARHYYSAFDSDASTTTLPERLAVKACAREALRKIFQKLGPAAKRIYGMAMALSENDLAEQEARWLDNSARRDMSDEDMAYGGDPLRGFDWGW